ncbi:amino acid ABC transporter permease [Dongia soli]|uniref:Amino acid ABC transporter permease n=1 Tax=Dongia soli TaxID=600628 RepID=A0ABU5EGJ8_9PROT|nr:amino acid ABC transporter permease [Dongia soli]MDY0885022.1 amino acid ABC transporter permease [Dongia soli]
MADIAKPGRHDRQTATAWWRDEHIRGLIAQAITLLIVVGAILFLIHNMIVNREAQGRPFSYSFMDNIAGFPIAMSVIPVDLNSTITRIMVAGMLNTMVAGVASIILATIVGFVIGVMRLSPNYLISRLAGAYIEVFRNIPLLVQLCFWYFGVLKLVPNQRNSLNLLDAVFLNVRGFYLPRPLPQTGFDWIIGALAVGIIGALLLRRWSRQRQAATGERFPVLWTGMALVVGLPVLAWLAVSMIYGTPLNWEFPVLKGFNFQGGIVLLPELTALVIGLSIYTAAYIAEIVRGGIQAVSHGQTEAALALGLRRSWTLRLVIIPQALRVIVPPLTSQYLNILKNSTLAVFVGYPDFVSVFTGTVLNQTGREVEVVIITMLFYLAISLTISLFMNWYNKHIALVER